MKVLKFGYFDYNDNVDDRLNHPHAWSRPYEYNFVLESLDKLVNKDAIIHNSCWGYVGVHITFKNILDNIYDNVLHTDIIPSKLPKTDIYDVTIENDNYTGKFDVVVNVSTLEEIKNKPHVEILKNLLSQVKDGGYFVATFDHSKNSGLQLEDVENFLGAKIEIPKSKISGDNSKIMLLLTYGTRPEWIKIQKLIEELDKRNAKYKVLFTGQHDNFFNSTYDYAIKIPDRGISRLNGVFSGIMLSKEMEELNPKWVLVQGDTASVCAISMKYYNLGAKIIHLEAGLRTYDLNNPQPEEAYRQIVSRITSLHLCPTDENKQNLINEKCCGDKYVVGNTVLDHIRDVKTTYGNTVLCTMHRRENLSSISAWFTEINNLAKTHKDLKFVLPIHPNPAIKKHNALLTDVNVVEPMQHDELISVMKDCKIIITDSGGIQEEGTFLQKRIVVCRNTSERDTKSGHITLCKQPSELFALFNASLENFKINEACPYGDGNSSYKICNIFDRLSII